MTYQPRFLDHLTEQEKKSLKREFFTHCSSGDLAMHLTRHEDGYLVFLNAEFSSTAPTEVAGIYGLKKLVNLNSPSLLQHDESYVRAHIKVEAGIRKELKELLPHAPITRLTSEEKKAFAAEFAAELLELGSYAMFLVSR